jgi:hypothetical protein
LVEDAMKKLKQISVALENQPGELTSLCSRLKRKGVEIQGICAPQGFGTMQVKLIVDDPAKAKETLDRSGMRCYFEEVLALDLDPRSATLAPIAAKLAERGVNVTSVYFTTASHADRSRAILSVSDIETAMSALKSKTAE